MEILYAVVAFRALFLFSHALNRSSCAVRSAYNICVIRSV